MSSKHDVKTTNYELKYIRKSLHKMTMYLPNEKFEHTVKPSPNCNTY